MTKPLDPATVTIALDKVSRILDGSSTTHAAGGTATLANGKTYSVHVVRIHEKQGSAFTKRGVYYFAALWLNGRKVREDALGKLRTLIEREFRKGVNEMAFKADQARRAAEAQPAPEAQPVAEQAPVAYVEVNADWLKACGMKVEGAQVYPAIRTWTAGGCDFAEVLNPLYGASPWTVNVNWRGRFVEAPSPATEAPEEPQAIVGLPSLDDETFWGSRLTPEEAKTQVRALRDQLGALAANLDHLDHAAARAIHEARGHLFSAWSVLRATQKALDARKEPVTS